MKLLSQENGLNMKEVSISTMILSRQGTEYCDLPTGLEMIAQAGFTHIELNRNYSDWPNIASIIKNLGLRVWACHGNLGFACVSKDPSVRHRARISSISKRPSPPFAKPAMVAPSIWSSMFANR